MANILFAWELGGGAGHIHILAPLAEALASRGHRVFLAARELTVADELVSHDAKAWRVAMLLFVSLLVHNFPEGLTVAASASVSPRFDRRGLWQPWPDGSGVYRNDTFCSQ